MNQSSGKWTLEGFERAKREVFPPNGWTLLMGKYCIGVVIIAVLTGVAVFVIVVWHNGVASHPTAAGWGVVSYVVSLMSLLMLADVFRARNPIKISYRLELILTESAYAGIQAALWGHIRPFVTSNIYEGRSFMVNLWVPSIVQLSEAAQTGSCFCNVVMSSRYGDDTIIVVMDNGVLLIPR